MSNATMIERTKFNTCGAQGTGWHEVDRCGSAATVAMIWRGADDKGRACSLCADCAEEMIGNESQFCALPESKS